MYSRVVSDEDISLSDPETYSEFLTDEVDLEEPNIIPSEEPYEKFYAWARNNYIKMLSWSKTAPCYGNQPWTESISDKTYAKTYCSRCDHKLECLMVAMGFGPSNDFVWGGVTQEQRSELFRTINEIYGNNFFASFNETSEQILERICKETIISNVTVGINRAEMNK